MLETVCIVFSIFSIKQIWHLVYTPLLLSSQIKYHHGLWRYALFHFLTEMQTLTINFMFPLIAFIWGSSFISENVVFEKVKEITTTRSKWTVAFLFDINPYRELLARLNRSIVTIKEKVALVTLKENAVNRTPYMRLLHSLTMIEQHVQNLELSREFLYKELVGIKSIHISKRSLIPIVGKALSLFLMHLSWRLKCTIVIMRRPSSVRR